MSTAKPLLTLALAGLCGAGGYSYWLQHKLTTTQATLADTRGDLARTTDTLSKCAHEEETVRADAAKTMATLTLSQGELDTLRAERAETEKRLEAFRALTEKFQKMIDSGKLQVTMRHGRMIVKLPAEILFASGSADVSKTGQAALAEVASVLKQIPERRFMIAGHTDNVPVGPPSPFKNNLQLSTARAETVTEQLIAAGMNAGRLSAAGYSEYEPARENATEAGRRENRRIEIVLLPNLAELPLPAELTAKPAASASAAVAGPSASLTPGPPSVH
jgi:chemotaxis protein MotB